MYLVMQLYIFQWIVQAVVLGRVFPPSSKVVLFDNKFGVIVWYRSLLFATIVWILLILNACYCSIVIWLIMYPSGL